MNTIAITSLLEEVTSLTVDVNDGIDHLPLSIITTTTADLKSYLGQVVQYYRDFPTDEMKLVSCKKNSSQLEIVVDSESKMIFCCYGLRFITAKILKT